MSIIEEAKAVAKLIQQIDNVELYQKILNLQAEIMDLVEENRKLKEEIRSLEDSLKIKESLKFQHNAYWRDLSDDKTEGPFCSKCWDKDKDLVRMISMPNDQYSQCPDCKQPVNTSGRRLEIRAKQRDQAR